MPDLRTMPLGRDAASTGEAPEEHSLVWRYLAMLSVVLVMGLAVVARMVTLQVEPTQGLAPGAEYQEIIAVPRGMIYDRNGHLLAGNQARYQLDIRLSALPESLIPQVGREVAQVLRLDAEALTDVLLHQKSQGTEVVQISKNVTKEQREELEKLAEAWVYTDADGALQHPQRVLSFVPHMVRFYPEGDLASNVLGFVPSLSDSGLEGVEEQYDAELRGGTRWVTYAYAPWNAVQEEQNTAPPQVHSLYLTLDRDLQSEAEKAAQKAVKDAKARSATIIVADPYTGAILAMAQYPRPDIRDDQKVLAFVDKWEAYNFAIERPYEPGSVFKIVTMAAALDAGVVTPETTFMDTGRYLVGAIPVMNWDRKGRGEQTMTGCLRYSLNTCLAWVAYEKLGKQRFYDYLEAFGIGQLTGIDLAKEAPGGYYYSADNQNPGGSDFDVAARGFGQGLYVTPLQMVVAASAIANGGYLVTPHVLYAEKKDGATYLYHPDVQRQVISAQVAQEMRHMLTESLKGETKRALVPGYSVAGKTGTAQIAVPGQGYVGTDTNASFVGWFPADKPQYVIYVWLERPQTSPWASVVAAPVFAEMVQRIAVLKKIPPDSVRESLGAAQP